MSILQGRNTTPLGDAYERIEATKNEIGQWIERHCALALKLGAPSHLRCFVGGYRSDDREYFHCDFWTVDGENHTATVRVGAENDFRRLDAEVVDGVSALTLIGKLLDRLGVRPTIHCS